MSAAAGREPAADLRISIWPEPSEDERVAIAAVIGIRSRRQAAAMAVDRMPVGSRWASAGRVEAMRAVDRTAMAQDAAGNKQSLLSDGPNVERFGDSSANLGRGQHL
ncbi:hypothetical protein BH23CHL4_BH23CHL4_08340 [soil metagenome]